MTQPLDTKSIQVFSKLFSLVLVRQALLYYKRGSGLGKKYKRRSLSIIKTIWRRLFSFGSCTLYPKKHQELDISGSIGLNRTMESQIFRNRKWRHHPKQVKRKLHNHSRF